MTDQPFQEATRPAAGASARTHWLDRVGHHAILEVADGRRVHVRWSAAMLVHFVETGCQECERALDKAEERRDQEGGDAAT